MRTADKKVLRLPDVYVKDELSNLYKLLSLPGEQIDDLREALEKTRLWRDVDEAEGKALDNIGSNVQEPRRGRDDDTYRKFIKLKIVKNLSKGDIPTLNEVIPFFINGTLKGIKEAWTLDGGPFPAQEAALLIMIYASMTKNNPIPYELINSIMAGGVGSPYWELHYIINGNVETQYKEMDVETDTNVKIKTDFIEAEQRNRYCGTFKAGEAWIV